MKQKILVIKYWVSASIKKVLTLFSFLAPVRRSITFTSGYRKISIPKDDILYIESHDSEVWVYTRDGKFFRNKKCISQWETLLGLDFLRIHRSYLVNIDQTRLVAAGRVAVGNTEVPISRKYKKAVRVAFSVTSDGK